MDTSSIKRGDDLMLFDAQGKSIAFATSHTLTISADATEINCKDAGAWKSSRVNKVGWEVQTENLFCVTAYSDLYTKMLNRTPITISIGEPSEDTASGINSPSQSYTLSTSTGVFAKSGSAILTSLTLNAASGDNATYSATLTGVGALS